jgi:oligosaccharide repeat unit polymerase
VRRRRSTHQDPRPIRVLDLVGFTFFGFFSCVLSIACWATVHWPNFLGPGFLAVCAAMAMLLHFTLASRRVSVVDPVIWIPIALLVFYFGMPFARFFGADISYEAWSVQPTQNLARGFGVALLTLTAFLTGMYLHGIEDRGHPQGTSGPDAIFLGWAGFVVLAIGAAFMLVGFFRAGPSVIMGMYGEIYANKAIGADFRLFDVGLIFAKAGAIGMLAVHRPQRIVWTSLATAAAVVIFVLSARLGDRGGLISFAFATAWIFSQRIRRIPISWIAVAGVVMVFLIPGVKEYRTTRSLAATLSLNPIEATSSTLFEAGTSVLTYAYTLDLIPAEKPYGWGISYVRAFLHLIPNLGLTPGKSFMPDNLVSNPGHWLTERIHPAKYEQGGGYGYSVGAEWYFNFGLPGVLIGMTLMGYMLCFFRERQCRGALWMVWSALLFTMFALIVRNIIGAPLKAATWSFVALWGVSSLLRVLTRSTSMRLIDQVTDERSGDVV